MDWSSNQIPTELQDCPPEVLERYVRARILALAGSASLGRKLGISPESIRQAAADSLSEAAVLRSVDSDTSTRGPPLQLTFAHDCQNLGCLEPGCSLCAQNPSRRCEGSFSAKYLAGDVLKAKCGASIRVQIMDRSTLDSVKGSVAEDIFLEMCILDGKGYAALQDAGRELFEEDVESCVLSTNNQGKELLVPGRGATHNEDKWVVVQLIRGEAHLPDLNVTGSSEALLSGQKPPFRLLVRAMNSRDRSRASHIAFAVSDAFVVATPRVRTAAKAEIPHLDDHVSKLHAVGNMTQNKLQDISSAAIAVGVYNIQVPYNTVTKVGQFKELVVEAEKDPQLCETLKKVLKLTRGWEVARDHAMTAVSTDNQMRIWYASPKAGGDSQDGGLLFKCSLGSVDLDNPVGLLRRTGQAGKQTTLEATLIQRLPVAERDVIKKLQKQAVLCWWRPGHPGWAIWPVDTQHFLQDIAAPAGLLNAEQLLGATSLDLHGRNERPLTRSATHAAHAAEAHSSVSVSSTPESHLHAQAQQASRSGSASEGGPSLDGWMPGNPPPLSNTGSRASSREVRFPLQPSPQSSPVWANPAYSAAPPQPQRQMLGPTGLHPIGTRELMQWEENARHNATEQLPNGGPGLLQHHDPAGTANDASLFRSWQGEAARLAADGVAMPSGPTISDAWKLNMLQPSLHHPSSYGGLRDYTIGPPGLLPGEHQMIPTTLDPMLVSGTVRKRDSLSRDDGAAAVALPGGESTPLTSPFGHPEMQNMEVPTAAQVLPVHNAGPGVMLQQRISSGMEPANAKRQHLSPAELQERLSQLCGRPLKAQELSRLIPNFPELLEDPNKAPDLPSMTLTTSDLASLMDILEPRHQGDHAGQVHAPATEALAREQGDSAADATDFLKFNSYTYGDLADAVGMMHEGVKPEQLNAGLDKARSSSMLMEYMAARLAGAEGQFLGAEGSPKMLSGKQLPPFSPMNAHVGFAPRRSGLETMSSMERALLKTQED